MPDSQVAPKSLIQVVLSLGKQKGEVKRANFSLFVGTKADLGVGFYMKISMARLLVLIKRELFQVCHYEMKILFGQ